MARRVTRHRWDGVVNFIIQGPVCLVGRVPPSSTLTMSVASTSPLSSRAKRPLCSNFLKERSVGVHVYACVCMKRGLSSHRQLHHGELQVGRQARHTGTAYLQGEAGDLNLNFFFFCFAWVGRPGVAGKLDSQDTLIPPHFKIGGVTLAETRATNAICLRLNILRAVIHSY